MALTSWKKEIEQAMRFRGETWDDIEACTLSDAELIMEFDSDYGGSKGTPFTLWTKNRVYFPVVYDGLEWVASVARNIDMIPTGHIGGE